MLPEKHHETIILLDFGGQYNQLIARRVREARVYCEMLPYNTPLEKIKDLNPRGIILTGGPSSVYDQDAPRCDPEIFHLGVPVLGICYGMQLMALVLGGEVSRAAKSEYGVAGLEVKAVDPLFDGLSSNLKCLMSHGDIITSPPPGFQISAVTANAPVAAMGSPEQKLYGVQFHPEVRHTPEGRELLQNFLYKICGCRGEWTMASFIDEEVAEIRRLVGRSKVICALSGGVDSAVAAALVHRAVGDQLTAIFVDHGLLRQGESEQVRQTFQSRMNFNYVDASDRFLQKLTGVIDPEQKRKIIGEEFIRVFEAEARRLGEVSFLVQGTLYSDVIESGTATAATIKSHHNVGGLPADMALKLIEPLRALFKDEVRVLGKELGLPDEIIYRQPFPGPGLAVRILGEVTRPKLKILGHADAIIDEEIRAAALDRDLWQWFAVLPGIKSVGVMGDNRTYAYPIVLRAVESEDAMTAEWARLPYDLLARISSRVVNEVDEVNRLVYDITSKPPGTIEWE